MHLGRSRAASLLRAGCRADRLGRLGGAFNTGQGAAVARPERGHGPGLAIPYAVRTLWVMRTQRLELRLTDEERSVDQAAAAAVGESLSDFFRRAAAYRAAEVLADQRRIALAEQEAIRFLDALETVDEQTVARLAELRSRP